MAINTNKKEKFLKFFNGRSDVTFLPIHSIKIIAECRPTIRNGNPSIASSQLEMAISVYKYHSNKKVHEASSHPIASSQSTPSPFISRQCSNVPKPEMIFGETGLSHYFFISLMAYPPCGFLGQPIKRKARKTWPHVFKSHRRTCPCPDIWASEK